MLVWNADRVEVTPGGGGEIHPVVLSWFQSCRTDKTQSSLNRRRLNSRELLILVSEIRVGQFVKAPWREVGHGSDPRYVCLCGGFTRISGCVLR